jgi:alkylation response protein AidB-like acyl-CoA dehydrogenase
MERVATGTPADLDDLRRAVRSFLESYAPVSEARRAIDDSGFAAGVWQRMGRELELQGLLVPTRFGGAGLGVQELVVVCEELGRVLFAGPYISSAVMATSLLSAVDDDAAVSGLLPRMASGALVATLGIFEPGGGWDVGQCETHAHNGVLDGAKTFVLDALAADVLLITARSEDGELGLFRVNRDAPGLHWTGLDTLDVTRKLATVTLRGTPAEQVVAHTPLAQALERALHLTLVALAAEMAGGAARVLEMATEYAKVRSQFGRPIGAFQAIKHKCADMLLHVELARSAARYAGHADATRGPDWPVAAHVAKAYCGDAFVRVATDNIQIHGGVGFTWEHAAHLFYRRAHMAALLFGDASYHREQILARLGRPSASVSLKDRDG